MAGPPPAVVCVAPNGARRTRSDHPALPLRPREVAEAAAACAAAGAQVLHLHVRDADDGHTIDPACYRVALRAVREAAGADLLVQVTTESVGRYGAAEQMAAMRALCPAAMSVAVRELVPATADETAAAAFLHWAYRERIGVQCIVYDAADTRRLVSLVDRGIVPAESSRPPHALFVLGRFTDGQRATVEALPPLLEAWRAGWPWTVCAFGVDEAACLEQGLRLGGHVRVGFENNTCRPDGRPARDNAEQVTEMVSRLGRAGRRPATRDEACAVYGVDAGNLLTYGRCRTEE